MRLDPDCMLTRLFCTMRTGPVLGSKVQGPPPPEEILLLSTRRCRQMSERWLQ